MVIKLENQIVEWNSFKKLCRRDEELTQIEMLLKEYSDDLYEMLEEIQKLD